ncbi:MAG: choice-of-anchor I family protein [bacterium]|nr:choice-of-anchor I family protein [bacterium]
MTIRTWTLAAMALAGLVAAPAPAHAQAPNACAAAKIRATVRAATCAAKLAGKQTATGLPPDAAKVAACAGKLAGAFAKWDRRGGCPTTADAATAGGLATALVADLGAQLSVGIPNACQAEKLRAAARRVYCTGALEARQAAQGGDLPPTRAARCASALAAGFARAEAKGGCTTAGDVAAIAGMIDAFLAAVDGALFPPPTTTTTTSTTTTTTTPPRFDLVWKGSYDPPVRGAEIVTVDPASRRMFIAAGNRVDIVDVADVTSPTLVTSVSMAAFGSDTTSVSVRNGRVAVAVVNGVKENPGRVVFLDVDGNLITSVAVGAVPDMVVHSPNGLVLAVANEGEPRCDGSTYVDPVGSISLIDLSSDPITQTDVTTVSFASLNGTENALRAAGIRIFGLGIDAAHDLEPESVAFSPDGTTLYTSLQEANAYATIDVASASLTSIRSFGYKDHSLAGNALDPSDRDGSGNDPALAIATWPVLGMYQPDGIGTFTIGGVTYLATANEGDSRGDYAACGGNEEVRGGDLAGRTLAGGLAGLDRDGDGIPALADNDELSRLQVTNQFPLPAAPNPIASLYVFGGRSMSIWNPATGALVFDSGDQIEQIVAAQLPAFHNSGVGKSPGDGFDTRSDNKGPEPEGLVVGEAEGRTLVFVGLERANGIMVWDVTDPAAPIFQEWERTQVVFDGDLVTAGAQPAGDLAPEGLAFVPAAQSWTGKPLLFVAHEADQPGTALPTRTSIFELTTVP